MQAEVAPFLGRWEPRIACLPCESSRSSMAAWICSLSGVFEGENINMEVSAIIDLSQLRARGYRNLDFETIYQELLGDFREAMAGEWTAEVESIRFSNFCNWRPIENCCCGRGSTMRRGR